MSKVNKRSEFAEDRMNHPEDAYHMARALTLSAQALAAERDRLAERVRKLEEAAKPALRYIEHVGSSFTMRGQPHPQEKIVNDLKSALTLLED